VHTGSDGFYIESRLVAHLVAEVDRLRDRLNRYKQQPIEGERQPSLFPPLDEPEGQS